MLVTASQSLSELRFLFSYPSLHAEPSSAPITGKINQCKAIIGICPVWSDLL